MFAIMAIITILPQHTEAFFKAQEENGEASLRDEPGCMAFHVLRGTAHGSVWDPQTDKHDRNRMMVYEVFKDKAAFEAHLVAPHYAKFRDTVGDMHAAPVQLYFFETTFPDDSHFTK